MKDKSLMQICFIEDTPYYGGGQEWLFDTTQEFIKLGHKINLIVPHKNKILIKKLIAAGAKVYTYNWEKISYNLSVYKKSWISGIKKANVVVCSVHPPRNNFHCVNFAAKCIKEAGNNAVLIPKTGTLVPTYIKEYYIPDPNIKTRISAITNFTRKGLGINYKIPSKIIKTLYQGVNTEKFYSTENTKNEANSRYKRNPLKPTIGVVGKFEERKGHLVLLDAVKELKDNHSLDIEVLFVGEGPTKDLISSKIRELQLEDNIKIYPFTSEPHYFYDSIDALVLPSLYKEGLPNVILEAMAMGKPCIASKLAGTAEVVKNFKTGLLVKPGDSKELAEAIRKLINSNNTLFKLGQRSQKFIHKNFDRKKQAAKYLKHFESLAKSRKIMSGKK